MHNLMFWDSLLQLDNLSCAQSSFQDMISHQSNTLVWTSNFKLWMGPFRCAQIQGLGSDFQEYPNVLYKEIGSCIYLLFPQGGYHVRAIEANARKDVQFQLFPRVPGDPLPFLLLDGHGSRLQLSSLRYMNHLEHPWIVCIGLPNGTALWKVGDAAEKNCCWKMSITKFKRDLVLFKIIMGLPPTTTNTDIFPLCNRVFVKSFT